MVKTILIFFLISSITTKSSAIDVDSIKVEEDKVLYVSDQLRLSLYEGAETKGKFIEYLISGDKVTLTRFAGPYAFIKTESGKVGWVKRRYLVAKLPNVVLLKEEQIKNKVLQEKISLQPNSKRLQQEQDKNKKLLIQLSKLKKQNLKISEHKKIVTSLNKQIMNLRTTKSSDQLKIGSLKLQMAEKVKKAQTIENQNKIAKPLKLIIRSIQTYWYYVFPLLLAFILIGFIIAKKVLEVRIKKKFQGIKVW